MVIDRLGSSSAARLVSALPRERRVASGVILCLLVVLLASCSRSKPISAAPSQEAWSPKAAAGYLDARETTWEHWPVAARDHGTFCISCHTALSYALARPALSQLLGETGQPAPESRLLADVRKRIALGDLAQPYYSDHSYGAGKALQSRGTESVLNALILAHADAQAGILHADTLAALAEMWAQQETSGPERGAWPWLQFNNEPFEAHDSAYYGAALAAVTAGLAPDHYRSWPAIQKNLSLLRDYLNRGYGSQSLINRVTALWAASVLPGLFTPARQRATIRAAFAAQRSDGGWSLSTLTWSWIDWSPKSMVKWARSRTGPLAAQSDGYATGLIAFTLLSAGVPKSEPHLARALGWLARNQQARGFWRSYSLNNRIAPDSVMGLFMSDAATAFAVLALAENSSGQPLVPVRPQAAVTKPGS